MTVAHGIVLAKQNEEIPPAKSKTPNLGDLLLELAGRSAGRMLTAKQHVRILSGALPLLDKGQRIIARRRIISLEQRWGPLSSDEAGRPEKTLPGDAPDLIAPELRTAKWLSKRTNWSRYIRVLHRAACYFHEGGTSLSDAKEYALKLEMDGVIPEIGLSSFTEWMAELRIAERVEKGVYRSGELCEWWANEMMPTRSEGTAYATCMDLAVELCRRKLPQYR